VADVVLGLGSNLGDRAGNLRRAVIYLQREGLRVTARSSIWETAPVPSGQPAFLNAAIRGDIELAPDALLGLVKRCERDLGRVPTYRWGPRVIDIDVLFYDDLRVETATLAIPHPGIGERAFVLAPLAEIWEGALPVLRRSAAELLARVDTTGVERTEQVL
jgi:2-amino-4-hydroxy-6-hydroxymethyldihydropteridine diphosphokinase